MSTLPSLGKRNQILLGVGLETTTFAIQEQCLDSRHFSVARGGVDTESFSPKITTIMSNVTVV